MSSLDFEQEKIEFRDYFGRNHTLLMDAESLFRNIISSLLKNTERVQTPVITGRIKEREECISKFSRKYRTYLEEAKIPYRISDHITDLIGIRIVCIYEDEVATVAEILRDNFRVLEETDKIREKESTEGDFGYKGLHLDLRLKENRRTLPEYTPYSHLRFEVQIRTLVQDAWSVMDHKIKYKKSIPNDLKRRINALAAQFELVDHEFLAIRDKSLRLEEDAEALPQSKAKNVPLDVFAFLAIVGKEFPGYDFVTTFADGFVEELLKCKGDMTAAEFSKAFKTSRKRVEKYKDQSPHKMNPYTMIRHALYLSDKNAFQRLLFDLQRNSLEIWLADGAA